MKAPSIASPKKQIPSSSPRKPLLSALAGTLAALFLSASSSLAAPPDLTAGGVPGSNNRTFNLGPTGMRGWAYYLSGNQADSSESRQILVSHVESGSPADGQLQVDDVILGANGTGATPGNFSSDARKSLAYAIQDAEARSTPTLKLLRWRSGTTTTVVTLTLQTMGAYTVTAPYSCPKSALILQQGMQYVYEHESAGRYSFGGLTHLATGDAAHLAKARTVARALVPSQSYMSYLRADEPDPDTSLPAWDRGHKLLFLAEYYLATGDTQVLPAIEAYALNVCKNRSLFGTFGHGFADWKNGPIGGGYGTVNSAGMPCLLGVLLAKECGLTNPELDPAIEAANRFFAWYSGKGAIPYGDHEPQTLWHENNGKSGLGAIYFGLQGNRVEEGQYFAKMCTAAASEREVGHTGSFFNYVWAPLGAAQGGEQAAAAHFSRISWLLDLNRCWDGRFVYDCLNGEGPVSSPTSDTYNSFKMSTAALLTYALPHRQLRITGKGHDESRWLTRADVTEALQAEDYDPDSRSNSQLISDLENWSAGVRQLAAGKLGSNGVNSSELSQITALATDTSASSSSRSGACLALGQIGDSNSSGVLAGLLTDSDHYVRYSAAEGMRHLPTSANLVHLDTILAAAVSTAAPLLPLNEEDPQHMAHSRLAMLLFNSGNPKGIISGNGIDGVNRSLLYPAIRAVAETPNAMGRSTLEKTYQNLTEVDVQALSAAIVDSVIDYAPANRMFSHGVRYGGVAALYQYNIAEGVPACKRYAETTKGGIRRQPLAWLGSFGGSVHTVTPDPGVVPYLETLVNDWEVGEDVQNIIVQIAADINPTQLVALKSIQSATADDPVLTLPANSTVLRVSGFDHMQGDSIYTWRKILGPGMVTISPNGTADTVSNLQFDGTPGSYQFEVTMSDSRGFTEVHETVTVFLREESEVDDDPPVSNPASFAVAPAAGSETAVSMTAAIGSDVSGPVEYLFSETTGNPGGTSSSWQTSPNYTDSGLSPLTQYAYTVTMRDSLANPGTTSSPVSVMTPGTPPASDVISVNFYAYGAMKADDYDAVTLEAGESAGFGGWNTAGWENYSVPWGLSSPASPVPISSTLGSTATLTLNDQRNGGPYVYDTPHVLLPGDGNGDLMDGHCNGSEDPYDGSAIFDMTVSNVSLGTYDVIVYIGGNRDQYGNGRAKYVFNGGAEQNFTLSSGEFFAFAEITNSTTPGNYLLFENVTGSSFTLQVWGNGFNHIGPTGFQIASAGSTSDANPPTPNPASFAAPPHAVDTSAISMTATTGSDASGPVEYLFSCLTAGGHGSGWQTSPSYTDTGLELATEYTYTVTMRDAVSPTPNIGTASAGARATTLPITEPAPDVVGMTESAARSAIVAGGFSVGSVYTAASATVPAGVVISQAPTAGTQTPAGSPVGIVVSLGDVTADIFSVNFYAYGALAAEDYDAVTLEADESAGVAAFNTTGWQNLNTPWGLESPVAPVTLSSAQANSATLTLNDLRNGGPHLWDAPHSNLPDDGNGDLMDGHGNGTYDPNDGSNIFDMQVSDIPYAVYDLIVYLGCNSAQFGDGTGKMVLNGGAERSFTLPSGPFTSFAEINDGSTPGNYIVFAGLRSASLALRVWGNGYNHIGPTGFQIVQNVSGVIPPGPASNPHPEDGVVGLPPDTNLSWTAGVDATSSNIYLGTNSTPGASEFQGNVTGSTFDPGTLAHGTYYWRVDEVNSTAKTTGPVWSFAVGSPAKAFRPMPHDGITAVAPYGVALSWVEGASASAVSSDVYFGTDSTPDASEFQGNQTATTFSPGSLAAGTTYYWRIDQVNTHGATTGDLWSFTTPKASTNRVKVFILAGQSNAEGHGEITRDGFQGTLDYTVANEAATYGHLKDGADWAERDDAWIWYKRGGTTLVKGKLTAGYGASATTIGPELQFGHAMGDYYGEKVLLIKTAWGGKSLRTDFRPPSSGWGLDVPGTAGDEGFYYKEMLDFVVDAMGNLPTYFPEYDPADGYEIAGFGWHHGWNDRVTPSFAAEYETNMVNFITDVRASLGVPALPFVIATTGMDGNPDYSAVELAQLEMTNVTAYPQFAGNVAVTDTQDFYFDVPSSPADQSYHWNRNAKSYLQIGQSMAEEMQALVAVADKVAPTPNLAGFSVVPTADSDMAIRMIATTGTDSSGPIQYLFTETTGNSGATSSSWQTSPSYTDSGLTPSTLYTYTVTMRDSLGNTGNSSAPVSVATVPLIPFFGTITYNENGSDTGTVPADDTSYDRGDSVTVLGNTGNLTKTGHSFDGWNTAVDGSGDDYAGGDTFTIVADTTLHARWGLKSYTISFDSAGGSVVDRITQDYGTAVAAPSHPTLTGYSFTGWDSALPATMPASNLFLTAQWIQNTAPTVDAGPDQTVMLAKMSIPASTSEWSYSAWTGDADSGINSNYTYMAAHCFRKDNSRDDPSADPSVTVNGVEFANSVNLSGSGWSIAGTVTPYTDNVGNLTGSSKDLVKDCIYFSGQRTVTFSGLTVGGRYKATFLSLAWGSDEANRSFEMTGGTSTVVNQNVYGDSNGITISCEYTATGETQEFTIDPLSGGFPLFAMANRDESLNQATATLDGTATDDDGDVPAATWTKVSGPGPVLIADASAVDTTATFSAAGTYVLRLTADDSYFQISNDVTITVSSPSPPSAIYTAWAGGTFANPFNDRGVGSDPDGDGRNNFWEFAFGTDPTLSARGSLAADGSTHGDPIPVTDDGGATFDFLFVRRDDHGPSGSLSYSVQFSSDLETFYDSGDTPSFVADSSADADYEVVKVPFPATLPNGQKASFARVKVVETP
jgi:hypothetical protein